MLKRGLAQAWLRRLARALVHRSTPGAQANWSRAIRSFGWFGFSFDSDNNRRRLQAVGFGFKCNFTRVTFGSENGQSAAFISLSKRQLETGGVIRGGTSDGGQFSRAADGEMNWHCSAGNNDAMLVNNFDRDVRKIVAIGTNGGAVGDEVDCLRLARSAQCGEGNRLAAGQTNRAE